MTHIHIDKFFEEELRELKEAILKMGSLVEDMIDRSMRSLMDRNGAIAEEVIRRDYDVDQQEMDIDELCAQLLALRQPAASDLRFIIVGLKITKDLERMGDLAVNVSEESLELLKEPMLKPFVKLPMMGEKTRAMIKEALDAFVARDAERAEAVLRQDDDVDELNGRIRAELIEVMKQDAANISRGMHRITVARHYERMADHATNIAEEVIYMVKGRDIRHGRGS
ncbi:MAG: phosphate signaling complex protein PhoU [Deltaproteobacteria bacterium]|nr:phosphate signaling complex protein PhoU [Deltaproteobacteria bacterium]